MVAASPRTAAAPAARVIFLGPPGAGKGTQAAKLAAHLGVPRISTGDMLREAIARGTELGRKAAPIMEQGLLVPDDLLIALVRERIAQPDCRRGFVLDGFPRTLRQAQGLAIMGSEGPELVVFEVAVPKDELLRRLSGRRWCPTCQATYHVTNDPPGRPGVCDREGTALVQREDDREAVVSHRLRQYEEQMAPLIAHYRERARLHHVEGHRPVEAVFEDLRCLLEARE